jgi:hypothetical protein
MLSPSDMENASLSRIIRGDVSFPLQFDTVNEDFKDFKTAVSGIVEINLDLLNEIPLPKNWELEALKEFFTNQIKSDLEKDVLFEKSVEISKYAKNMYESMDSYFKEIFDYYEQQQKELSLNMFCVSKMFLNSDLPMSFLRSIEDSMLAEKDYVEIYVKKIRHERLSLLRYRNNRTKFQRVCDSHNTWVNRLENRLAEMERGRVKLIWYVDFNNSVSFGDIFKDKIVKISFLEKQILLDLIKALQDQVHEMEKLNISMTEFSSFLPFEIDDGTRAIRKIMQLHG